MNWNSKVIFFPMLVVEILVLGLMIPTFYEWSGADQSRPSPYVPIVFCAFLGFVIVAWIALPWLPQREKVIDVNPEPVENPWKFQFNSRALIIVTSLVAFTIAAITSYGLITAVWIIMLPIFFSAWFVMRDLSTRWKLAALLACMYFPYAWVVLPGAFKGIGSAQIFGALGLPTFVPTILLGQLLEQRLDENIFALLSITGIELAIGIWIVCSGPRRAVAWILFVLFLSFIGSSFLNAAIRI